MNHISIDEQETIIRFYRTDEMLDIYTSDQTMITKLKKLLANSDEYKLDYEDKADDGRTLDMQVLAPKKFLTLRSKDVSGRQISDERRRAMSENMRAIRKRQLSKEKETKN